MLATSASSTASHGNVQDFLTIKCIVSVYCPEEFITLTESAFTNQVTNILRIVKFCEGLGNL
jgi:Pyruvate/2-oxoacid:ferredoxin oxidoreductase delta subunit